MKRKNSLKFYINNKLNNNLRSMKYDNIYKIKIKFSYQRLIKYIKL